MESKIRMGGEERDKETKNIGSGLFASIRAHIKDCEVLVRFQVGKSVDKSF